MTNYIVKNCPKYRYGTCIQVGECKNITDCLIKQVIEKCKPALNDCMCSLANEILQMFEVEIDRNANVETFISTMIQSDTEKQKG